ncbi:MAG: HPr family phosphocarrier protein [Planctomycetota bacterium]|jgi:phosphotransferase system HPr-like phosphotransfer protein
MTLKDAAFTGSRERVIPEEAFLPVVEKAAAGLLALRKKVEAGGDREWSRSFVSRLLKEIHALRTVLTENDAQENRTYSYFYELVAGIRGFGTVLYVLKHLRSRYLRSPLSDDWTRGEIFLSEITQTLTQFGETMRSLFVALLEECDQIGIELPESEAPGANDVAADPGIRQHLPHNLDEEEMGGEGEKVAQVASSFVKAAEIYETLVPPEGLTNYPALREFVLGKLDEERSRSFESRIHTIQSKYDTYIQYTNTEAKDPDLRRLRAVISVSLHLIEVTTHLVHFYERHENDIRSEKVKERISGIVDKFQVLDRAVNFAFRGAGWLMAEGREISERLIPAYTSIQEVTFSIPEEVRLHIRPAALVASIVNEHGTPVRMMMGESECDASSVTDVIFLAGSNIDVRRITFRGDERPLADLRVLFDVGLEDSEHEELYRRLPYLDRR